MVDGRARQNSHRGPAKDAKLAPDNLERILRRGAIFYRNCKTGRIDAKRFKFRNMFCSLLSFRFLLFLCAVTFSPGSGLNSITRWQIILYWCFQTALSWYEFKYHRNKTLAYMSRRWRNLYPRGQFITPQEIDAFHTGYQVVILLFPLSHGYSATNTASIIPENDHFV